MHTSFFINLYLFGHTLLKEAENQQTESGVVQKAQRKVKKKKKKRNENLCNLWVSREIIALALS